MTPPLTDAELAAYRADLTRPGAPELWEREDVARLLATLDERTRERDELALTLANERGEGPGDGWRAKGGEGEAVRWAKRLDPNTVAHVATYDVGTGWNVRIVRMGEGLIWHADNVATARQAMRDADAALESARP
jgi:hypothetical protein